jgi:hypothetical protein
LTFSFAGRLLFFRQFSLRLDGPWMTARPFGVCCEYRCFEHRLVFFAFGPGIRRLLTSRSHRPRPQSGLFPFFGLLAGIFALSERTAAVAVADFASIA